MTIEEAISPAEAVACPNCDEERGMHHLQLANWLKELVDARILLKVAEKAIIELRDRLVASVYDGSIDPHEALKIAEDALAAMLEEGGEE